VQHPLGTSRGDRRDFTTYEEFMYYWVQWFIGSNNSAANTQKGRIPNKMVIKAKHSKTHVRIYGRNGFVIAIDYDVIPSVIVTKLIELAIEAGKDIDVGE